MPGPFQARMGDMHLGPACTVTGPMPITGPCVPTVMVVKKPAATMGDMCLGVMLSPAGVPVPTPPHPIAKGSTSVMIGKKPAARMTDICGMGGTITIVQQFTVTTGG